MQTGSGKAMSLTKEEKNKLKKYNFKRFNSPKRTPNHPTKSHAVLAKEGDKIRLIRFGQQGVSGAGSNPRSEKEKARRRSFKARHAKNIARGKMSPAYWSSVTKWVFWGAMLSGELTALLRHASNT